MDTVPYKTSRHKQKQFKIIKMKNWKIRFMSLVTTLLCLWYIATLVSCGNVSTKNEEAIEDVDSSTICTSMLTDVMYSSVTDFQVEQAKLQSTEAIKRIFLEMSPQMIERVSKVVLSKNATATIEDLVTEYRLNYDIYSRQIDKGETPPKKDVVEPDTQPDTSNLKPDKHEETSIVGTLLRR